MMNGDIKRKIDTLRDLLVGVLPVPTDQIKQITLALIYKFMSDQNRTLKELGGDDFFGGEYAPYAWTRLMDPSVSAAERVKIYRDGLEKMAANPRIPPLFCDIFRGAYLPFNNPATLDMFLKGIDEIEYTHSEDLGDAFEHLLSVMGAQGDAGQFRTPRHIIDFIVAAVDPAKGQRVLDPACGTAGFLVSAYRRILAANTKPGSKELGSALAPDERQRLTDDFCGYDISSDMARLSRVNLYLHLFPNPKIYEYDTLTSLERWDEVYDCILTNPPFMSPRGGIQPHNRFSIPSKRSEVLFVDYILEHLSPDGRAGIIVPEGIIFQSQNAHKALRKKLVEEDFLYAVVSLPAGVFQPYSGVKTSILLIDRALARRKGEIMFVKVEADGFDLGAQRNPVERDDLPGALESVVAFKNNTGKEEIHTKNQISYSVNKEKISKSSDYSLTGDRYLETLVVSNKKWPFVELGKIISLEYGKPLKAENRIKGDFPVFGSNGIVGYHNDYLVDGPFIVVGRKGSAGKIHLSNKNGFPIDTTFYVKIINSNELDIIYLYYQLKKLDLGSINIQAGVPGLNRDDAYRQKIPLPPLEVQREIVAEIEGYQKIIDGARMVVANWKPRIKIDPAWLKHSLEEICEFTYGFTESAQDSGDVRFIRITDIDENGLLRSDTKKYVNFSDAMKEFTLSVGDLVVARTGATYGKTLYFASKEKSIYASYLIKLKFDQTKVSNKYYWFYSQTQDYWEQAKSLVTGGGQPQFNSNAIKKIMLPLPSLSVQKEIITKLEEEQKIIDSNKNLIEIFEKKIEEKIGEVWGAAQ